MRKHSAEIDGILEVADLSDVLRPRTEVILTSVAVHLRDVKTNAEFLSIFQDFTAQALPLSL